MNGDAASESVVGLALPPALLDELAERVAPRVAELLRDEAKEYAWLDSDQAADHLGIAKGTLHKLTSARRIPFEQDGPGCRLYFKRSELDRWRSGGGVPD
jgi:excisionase family DNA binding protein